MKSGMGGSVMTSAVVGRTRREAGVSAGVDDDVAGVSERETPGTTVIVSSASEFGGTEAETGRRVGAGTCGTEQIED